MADERRTGFGGVAASGYCAGGRDKGEDVSYGVESLNNIVLVGKGEYEISYNIRGCIINTMICTVCIYSMVLNNFSFIKE